MTNGNKPPKTNESSDKDSKESQSPKQTSEK